MLIAQVRAHYISRDFSDDAVSSLLQAIEASHRDSQLSLPGTGCDCTVNELVDCFKPINQTPVDVSIIPTPRAIFGFAFGYRLRSQQIDTAVNRLPGESNRALAQAIVEVRSLIDLPSYVQFEISDALKEQHELEPAYSAPVADMNTIQAITYFLKEIGWWKLGARNIIVIAHTHHIGRCILLLKDKGLFGHVPRLTKGLPKGYDKHEAQARVRTETDCIHNDFISMVARFLRNRGAC